LLEDKHNNQLSPHAELFDVLVWHNGSALVLINEVKLCQVGPG